MPRQDRLTDPKGSTASLRQPLSYEDLASVALPTSEEFPEWERTRRNRLASRCSLDRYHRDRDFRKRWNRRRFESRRRTDPEGAYQKRWYEAHSREESEKAVVRNALAKAKDPGLFNRRQRRL